MRTPVLCAALIFCAGVRAGSIETRLAERMRLPGEVAVIVRLKEPATLSRAIPGRYPSVRQLRRAAHETQGPFLRTLSGLPHSRTRILWVVNAVAFTAPPDIVTKMAARPDVDTVTLDHAGHIDGGVSEPMVQNGSEVPWDMAAIRADALWNEGIDGTGVTVGVIDTGVDAAHPILAGKMAPNGWLDVVSGQTAPYDDHGHGTFVTGLICGGGSIGTAPGARYLSAKAIDSTGHFVSSAIIAAGQWMADPNGDNDPSDAPSVVNCSLGYDDLTVTEFHPVLELWRSLDIIPVISAGNNGPRLGTVTSPGSDPLALSVGATNVSDGIADFSSRGPAPVRAPFDGVPKPDIAAPGVNVRSALRGGAYGYMSGTSIAAPHVTGAAALVLQALPTADRDDVYRRLTSTAVDKGAPGPDSAYGEGRLDAYAAVHMAVGFVPARVAGTVRDEAARPIPDAVVDVSGTRALTGIDGRFTVPHTASGTYSALVDAPGYGPVTVTVTTASEPVIVLTARDEPFLHDGGETGAGWLPNGSSDGLSLTNEANRTPGGQWCWKISATGDTVTRAWLSPIVPLCSGTVTVNASYAWRAVGNGDGRVSGLVWLNANGSVLSIDYGTTLAPPVRGGPEDGVWRSVLQAYHVTPPAGATGVRLLLGASFPAGDTTSAVYFDDAALDIVASSPCPAVGDANGNGSVDAGDAAAALRLAGGLAPAGNMRADVWPPTGDTRVTMEDAVTILRMVLGYAR